MNPKPLFKGCIFSILLFVGLQASAHSKTVLEIMLSEIEPASDTIWDAYDLQTEQQWQQLNDAANRTAASFEKLKRGGSGVNDQDWAKSPEWIRLCDDILEATQQIRAAIKQRNEDLLAEASDALYPPCESCHIKFQPNGVNQ